MQAISLTDVIHAFINFTREKPLDASALGRLAWWQSVLGTHAFEAISADDIDVALIALNKRGVMKPRRKTAPVATGKPLAPATINRYISTFGELFKHAKRAKVIKRAHPSPLEGLERAPEPVDPDRYFRAEQVEAMIKVARILDRRWGRMAALIRLAFVTGIRVGNLMALRWCDVDLIAGTVIVGRTKNGDPNYAPINAEAIAELRKLPQPASLLELVFRGKKLGDRPHNIRKLWLKVTSQTAGCQGRNFHQVRHGTGSQLARSNVNQAGIMAAMGHRTLSASARYIHHNLEDRRATLAKAFGK